MSHLVLRGHVECSPVDFNTPDAERDRRASKVSIAGDPIRRRGDGPHTRRVSQVATA
jgi:hypothetical protein